jgi:small conductance mechanosensitive channel
MPWDWARPPADALSHALGPILLPTVVAVAAYGTSWLVQRRVGHWAELSPSDTADLERLRRRETAAALITSGTRYVLMLLAAVIVIGYLVKDKLTAAAGATFVILILVFGAQRFLQDVIAGFFIVVEGQYGVGDFVTVHPMGLAGMVEELGLRTTVIRNLNGDRYFVPNGQISAVERSPLRFRSYNVEMLTDDPERAEEALADVAGMLQDDGARFLRPPHVVQRREVGDSATLLQARADVPPTMEWLAEDYLPNALQARLEGSLRGSPLVYTLDDGAVRRYRRTVLFR